MPSHIHHRAPSYVSIGLLAAAFAFSTRPAQADNPIVQHVYTADPAPMVYGDTVYLYTSHDEDVTVNGFFTMNDWRVFSSQDMVNWTDHGSPLSWEAFSWASANKSWAPHGVERDGKFYLYVPVSDKIGVAVSDSPLGPFEDAIGAPLLSNYQYIDPTVFIDEDGQAYLYFGNPKLWYVKLNEDMISYSGSVEQIPMTTQSFGTRRGGATADRPSSYEEGPWFYRRDDLYYMVYPTGELPEHIAYSTSPAPTGPWTYGGEIMNSVSGHAFTNHPGVIDFKGHSYFFYHTQELPGGGGYKRSVALEEFTYGADGSIPTIEKTSQGPDAVDNLNPYERTEGETIAWTGGVEVEDAPDGGRAAASIENNDYIKVKAVDFLTGAISFEAMVASANSGGDIELHLDEVNGQLLGTCSVPGTGGWQMYQSVTCDVETVADVHDLFLVFKGGGGALFNLDWWQFTPKDPLPMGSGGATGAGGGSDEGTGGTNATGGAANGTGGTAPGAGGSTSNASGGATAAAGSGGLAETGSGGLAGSDGELGADPAEGCSCSSGAGRGDKKSPWVFLLGWGPVIWLAQRRARRSTT